MVAAFQLGLWLLVKARVGKNARQRWVEVIGKGTR